VFRLYNMKEDGGLVDLSVRLSIRKVGESIIYVLEFGDVERWREFFKQELEAGVKAAVEVGARLLVEDRLPYMLGWVNSDVAISGGLLQMGTSHLWQLAETHALFGWSYVIVSGVSLTLEGPKPQFYAHTSLEKLDEAIRRSAEGGWLKMLGVEAESWEGLKQWVAEHWDVVVDAAARRLGEEVRSELKALRNKLNDDKIAREVIAPALLLLQAEKLGVNETTLRYLGAVISGAISGDGYMSAAMGEIGLASGKRGVALLWAAAFATHGINAEARDTGKVIVYGKDATRLAGLYFLFGPPLLEGDERIINYKLAEAVKLGAEGLDIRWEGLRRRTEGGLVAADLTISVGGANIKYGVYLRDDTIALQFQSTDRSRVELAARLLKLAGVDAEVTKVGNRDEWLVYAYTDRLATGHEKLRKALAEIVRTAVKNGPEASKAEGWLEKLKRGRVLMEGWPKYEVGLTEGALMVRFSSTNSDSIAREAQRLRDMGLEEGVHFTVKMPEGGKAGYVNILKEGLAYAAWLSVNSEGEQQKLAERFVELILRRAEEKGDAVSEKAQKIIEEGKAWGSQTLERFEKRVEVGGKEHVVKVIGGGAKLEESWSGKKLLRLTITAEVDGVRSDYTITFSRYGRNAALGFATARADAPGGREADAERFAAVIKALTGREPKVYQRSDGKIEIKCYEGHLEGFMLYKEFFGTIMQWLKDTSRRGRGADREGAEDAPQGRRHDNDKA
jgi:23S rRNA pseudoU1915 N3-methylase RlmH